MLVPNRIHWLVLPLLVALEASCGGGHAPAFDDSSTTPDEVAADHRPTSIPQPNIGNALPMALSWSGVDADGHATTAALADYLDADGTKGITAILFETVSPRCGKAREESPALAAKMAAWRAKGIRVVELVIDDASGGAPTVDSAHQWQMSAGAAAPVVADPTFTFSHPGSNPLPVHVVVDPRTLTVLAWTHGADPTFGDVETFAAHAAP